MLYHWYELDQETAAPTNGADTSVLRPRTPSIHYNAEAAMAHARGTPFRLSESITLSAANDQHADSLANRLRDAGLGLVGAPRQRALPGHYGLMQRSAQVCRATLKFISVGLAAAFERFAWMPRPGTRYGVSSCSHTMVSNSTNYTDRRRDGAQRQRFNASIG